MNPLTEADQRAIRSLYETGAWSHKQLAEKFSVRPPSIRRILKSQGVAMRPHGRPQGTPPHPLEVVWAKLAPELKKCMDKAEKRHRRAA
ncbi:MAG: hypothetical protein H0W86_14315 [Armatimonadetes bacterium]|nr:hypothetical protein [Armatimonadota bacterium]